MTTKNTSTAAAAAFVATALATTVAFAQGNPTPQVPAQEAPMSGQGRMGMGGMDHGGMMDMAQMNRMMENCNRMMESKHSPSDHPSVKPNKG